MTPRARATPTPSPATSLFIYLPSRLFVIASASPAAVRCSAPCGNCTPSPPVCSFATLTSAATTPFFRCCSVLPSSRFSICSTRWLRRGPVPALCDAHSHQRLLSPSPLASPLVYPTSAYHRVYGYFSCTLPSPLLLRCAFSPIGIVTPSHCCFLRRNWRVPVFVIGLWLQAVPQVLAIDSEGKCKAVAASGSVPLDFRGN